jgi:type VI protein secretion system component VasF
LADSEGDKSVKVVKQAASSCVIEDTLYTVLPKVAPPLPLPALDPHLQLQQSQKSPLVSAVSSAPMLLVSACCCVVVCFGFMQQLLPAASKIEPVARLLLLVRCHY